MKYVVLLVILMFQTACTFEIVDAGHRGVSVINGRVGDEALPEGFYWKYPFIEKIVEIDVRALTWKHETSTYTKDVQQAELQFIVNYNVKPDLAHDVYKKYGGVYERNIIQPVVVDGLKAVVGRWDAVDLIANREQAKNQALEIITKDLDTKGFVISSMSIIDIGFQKEFEKAVENKVVAIQEAIEAKNRTVKIKEEADQKIISARAEAESMRIRSQALSQNKSLVEYEAVQKWDGKMPTYMMGNSVPFINIGK